jgi:hypothetical protein
MLFIFLSFLLTDDFRCCWLRFSVGRYLYLLMVLILFLNVIQSIDPVLFYFLSLCLLFGLQIAIKLMNFLMFFFVGLNRIIVLILLFQMGCFYDFRCRILYINDSDWLVFCFLDLDLSLFLCLDVFCLFILVMIVFFFMILLLLQSRLSFNRHYALSADCIFITVVFDWAVLII